MYREGKDVYRPLGTHGDDGARRRPDEHDPFLREPFGKLGVLAEETIPTHPHPFGQTNACTLRGNVVLPRMDSLTRRAVETETRQRPASNKNTSNTDLCTALVTHLNDLVHAQLKNSPSPRVNTAPLARSTRTQTNATHIALGRRRRTDAIRLVGVQDVQRRRVRVAVHRHGLDPQLLGRPDHATGDLPPEPCTPPTA